MSEQEIVKEGYPRKSAESVSSVVYAALAMRFSRTATAAGKFAAVTRAVDAAAYAAQGYGVGGLIDSTG